MKVFVVLYREMTSDTGLAEHAYEIYKIFGVFRSMDLAKASIADRTKRQRDFEPDENFEIYVGELDKWGAFMQYEHPFED